MERTAFERGQRVFVKQEIRSIAGIKALIRGGSGAGILPYGTVINDWRDGHLSCRPIANPTLRRVLHLAGNKSARGTPGFAQLFAVVDEAIDRLADAMAPLGERLAGRPDPAI